MTFYKSVEQKDANPQLTPAADAKTDTAATRLRIPLRHKPAPNAPDPTTTLPTASSYFVQVAAVSKQEDADSLVDALKKKQYPAFDCGSCRDRQAVPRAGGAVLRHQRRRGDAHAVDRGWV